MNNKISMLACVVYSMGLSFLVSPLAHSYDMSKEAIQQRIEPFGQVTIATEETGMEEVLPAEVEETQQLQSPQVEPIADTAEVTNEGELIYDQYCAVCHAMGIAGAPKFRDSASWQGRSDQGMAVLLEHATDGFNAMPRMGTCSTCDASQLKAAIEYMLPE